MNTPSLLKGASKGMVGALAIAGGTQAYGDVVSANLPTNLLPSVFPTTSTASTSWDVNNDGTVDFTFSFRQPQTTLDWQGNMFALANSAVLGYTNSYTYATRLSLGQPVGPSGANTFQAGTAAGKQFIIASRFNGVDYGQFQPPSSTGYIGFQFTVGTNTFNGYIHLKIARSFGIQFLDAAWNNTPGGAITAGQPAAVPEPGSLALLAVGAAALTGGAVRRRRAAKREA